MPHAVNLKHGLWEWSAVTDEFVYGYLHFPAMWAPGQRPVRELCPLKLQRQTHRK